MRSLWILMLGLALSCALPAYAQDDDADFMPDDSEEGYEDDSSMDSGEDSGDDFDDSDFEDDSGSDEMDDETMDDDTAQVLDAVEEDASADGDGWGDEEEVVDGDDDGWGDEDDDWGDWGDDDSVETVSVDSEEDEAEPEEPWHIYVGAGQAITTVSLSTLPADDENDFSSGVIRARAGLQLFENIDVEMQFGQGQATEAPDELQTDSYYGLFLVPSTSVGDVVEFAFPVGYAQSTINDESFGSIAFGANLELPLRNFSAAIPDIRITAGWMTYYQRVDARLYGFNVGLRYDFDLGGDPDWESGW